MNSIIESINLSKWYGQVMGVNDVTLKIGTGITGLLGPNGAGKSTLLKLMVGMLKPSKGEIKVFGEDVWNNTDIKRIIGYCSDKDAFYENMTGLQFVASLMQLNGYSKQEADQRALEAIQTVNMLDFKDRKIASYSMGMRQRIKLAQSIVHDPDLLFLDEPLNGMDPIGRHASIALIKELGAKGKSIIVSSHILYEVEAMTDNVILINNGRILAEGNIHEIRELIDEHPHNVYIKSDKERLLASILMAYDDVVSIKMEPEDSAMIIETNKPDSFYARLPKIILENGIKIEKLYSPDDNLEAVFKYLVG
ncbi:MAG: ABC transporter ATP-binding protein [bacterium]